jgi:hypothetical protein
MRKVEITVFKFEELKEDVKQKVFSNWCSEADYPFASDNAHTLKEFERIFPVKVKDYKYGDMYKEIDFSIDTENYNYYGIEDLEGIRLYKFIYNNYYDELFRAKSKAYKSYTGAMKYYKSKVYNEPYDCPLSGYYIDYDILKPLYDYLEKPNFDLSLWDLMNECLQEWLKACDNDYDNYYSMDSFIESDECNNIEYYADGSIFLQ